MRSSALADVGVWVRGAALARPRGGPRWRRGGWSWRRLSDGVPFCPSEEARGRVLGAIDRPLPAEEVPVVAALGRVLAAGVRAATDLPPWDNSAMDGYAILAADVGPATEAGPVRLAVTGEVAAGAPPEVAVVPGTAVRIATGAPLPPGADAVVPVELTTPVDAAGRAGPRGRDAAGPLAHAVLVHVPVGRGANIRRRGDDLRAGAEVLAAGSAIGPAEVALASGAGVPVVAVHRRARVAIISTATSCERQGRAWDRPASPTPTAPPSSLSPWRRAPMPATSGSLPTTWRG